MDLLMAIEQQASQGGGRAIVLLGNHELMNLLGEQRDVTPAIYDDVCRRRLGVAPRARVDAVPGAGGGARQGPPGGA